MAAMIDGAMQDCPLTLDRFVDHAAKWHPEREVVSARSNCAVTRLGYAVLRDRSRRISVVLAGLGVTRGEHVATLAWNTQAHVESWYAIMGMGAICHTLNPRQIAQQLAAMASAAVDRVLIASADLLPLARAIAGHSPGIECILVIDGTLPSDLPVAGDPDASLLEPLVAAAGAGSAETIEWGRWRPGCQHPGVGRRSDEQAFDPVVMRLIGLLKQALPECPAEDIFWCYRFVTGALLFKLARKRRIDTLSGGLCQSDDFPAVKARMARIMAAGLTELCGSPPSARDHNRGNANKKAVTSKERNHPLGSK